VQWRLPVLSFAGHGHCMSTGSWEQGACSGRHYSNIGCTIGIVKFNSELNFQSLVLKLVKLVVVQDSDSCTEGMIKYSPVQYVKRTCPATNTNAQGRFKSDAVASTLKGPWMLAF